MPPARRALGTASALVVLAGLTACGSDEGQQPPQTPITAGAGSADATGEEPATTEPGPAPSDDPADTDAAVVDAVRTYFTAAYRAIEDDDLASQALRDASTPARADGNAAAFADVVGLSAPGPLPFTPIGVEETAADARTVVVCAYYTGWLRPPGSDQPTEPLEVRAARVGVQDVAGAWKVDSVELTEADCSTAQIQEELW